MIPQYASFPEFYKSYLMDHAHPHSRKVHFAGFGLHLLTLGLGIYFGEVWIALLGIAMSYSLAWVGHFYFEKNKPTTFGKPYWSMRAGRKMFVETLIGRLDMSTDWNKEKVLSIS